MRSTQERRVQIQLSRAVRSFRGSASTALLIIGVFSVASFIPLQAPVAERNESSDNVFSTTRALTLIRSLAVSPHPLASPENFVVRDFIEAEIRRLGLEPLVQDTAVLQLTGPGSYAQARVQNVMTRIPGYANTKTVLLVAHYDTVPSSPGASDDSSGVATILETCRVLQKRGHLRNDVVFLFTDGEEEGLLGAKSFVRQDPWASNIGVVLNFEARGTSGPSFLFETTDPNGWLIPVVATSVRHPLASSLFFELYRHMPYDTDLSVFRERGIPGLNFAFIGHPLLYHTSADDAMHLDSRSLEQQGGYSVSLAEGFGNADLLSVTGTNVVFFNLGSRLLYYPERYVVRLASLTILILVLAIGLGIRVRAVRLLGVVRGTGLACLLATSACLIGIMSWLLLRLIVPEFHDPGFILFSSWWYELACVFSVVVAAAGLLSWFGGGTSRLEVTMGSLVFCSLLSVLLAFSAPGASYLLQWPCLTGLLCSLSFMVRDRGYWLGSPAEPSFAASLATTLACGLSTAVALVLVVPVVHLLFEAVGMLAILPATVTVAILLCIVMPSFLVVSNRSLRRTGWFAGGLLLLLSAGGIFTSHYTADQPKHDNLFYALNTDARKAVWATRDRFLDPRTTKILGRDYHSSALSDFVPFEDHFKYVDAPILPLTPPSIALLGNNTSESGRTLELLIRSESSSTRLIVWHRATAPQIYLASVESRNVTDLDNCTGCEVEPFSILVLDDVPRNGVKIRVKGQAGQPIELYVLEYCNQLPELPAQPMQPRSAWMARGMESPLFNDSTVVSRHAVF